MAENTTFAVISCHATVEAKQPQDSPIGRAAQDFGFHPMDISPDGDVQSWVINRLPLNPQQKWNLIMQLKEEKKLTQDEIDALNKTEFIDDEKSINDAIEANKKKLEMIDRMHELSHALEHVAPARSVQSNACEMMAIEQHMEHFVDRTQDTRLASV